MDALRQAVQHANAEVTASSIRNAKYAGMATTLTAAYLTGSRSFIGHVGDSRCYLIRADRIHQLTIDHGQGNMLRHALGVSLPPPHQMCQEILLENNDTILVCSDGLSNMLQDQTIADTIVQTPNSAEACSKLAETANANGGADNISIAMARITVRFVQR
jgi:protein phosphatase